MIDFIVIVIAVMFVFLLCSLPFVILAWLFDKNRTMADLTRNISVMLIAGGIFGASLFFAAMIDDTASIKVCIDETCFAAD